MFGDRVDHVVQSLTQACRPVGSEYVDEQLPDPRGMARRAGRDRLQALLGRRDLGVAGVLADQATLLHPAEVVGHPALLPLGRLSQLWAQNRGYELSLVYVTAATALAFTGPGAYSLDNALGLDRLAGTGRGLAAVVAGALSGLVVSLRGGRAVAADAVPKA